MVAHRATSDSGASGFRAAYVPSGLTTTSQDQRSQFANEKVAGLRLALLLDERRREAEAGGKRALWDRHHALERGNAVRSYEGERLRLR